VLGRASRALLFATLLPCTPVRAGESQLALEAGPGREQVAAHCTTCHSLDYVPMNSVFLDRKGWDAEVRKMIEKMGAPIPPQDAAKIIDYLSTHYGKRDP
jgi:hypothetical protein